MQYSLACKKKYYSYNPKYISTLNNLKGSINCNKRISQSSSSQTGSQKYDDKSSHFPVVHKEDHDGSYSQKFPYMQFTDRIEKCTMLKLVNLHAVRRQEHEVYYTESSAFICTSQSGSRSALYPK